MVSLLTALRAQPMLVESGCEWERWSEEHLSTAVVWVWPFLVIVVLIMLNMVLAIMLDVYNEVRQVVGSADSVFLFLSQTVRRLCKSREWIGEHVLVDLLPEMDGTTTITKADIQEMLPKIAKTQLDMILQACKDSMKIRLMQEMYRATFMKVAVGIKLRRKSSRRRSKKQPQEVETNDGHAKALPWEASERVSPAARSRMLEALVGGTWWSLLAHEDSVASSSARPKARAGELRIILQLPEADMVEAIHVEAYMTVSELRKLVAKGLPFGPGETCSLLLRGSMLSTTSDDLSLADLWIEDGAMLTVVKQAGIRVLTSSEDGTAKLWDAEVTGECINTFRHALSVHSAVFSPDSLSVLTASADGIARLWNTSTGECTQTMAGHTRAVMSAVFSADGSLALTASIDGTARIWKTCTGECMQILSGHAGITFTGQVFHGHWPGGFIFAGEFSSDGSVALTAAYDGTAKIWNLADGQCVQTLSGHRCTVTSAVFSPDGSSALTASFDQTAKLWNTSTGRCQQTLTGHLEPVNSAAFSADGSLVLTASRDRTAKVWQTSTGTCTLTLRGHAGSVNSASFSPDGSAILTASDDGSAKIWDASTGMCTGTLRGHAGRVNSAVFSADGWW